jgi:anti-sigma factor RsiW
MNYRSPEHVSADRLQALLDGALRPKERARVEEHVAACPRCSEELEGWRALFEDLAALPRLGPAEGFGGRVMASVELPGRVTLTERLGRAILALLPAPRPEHPTGELLQDYVDGSLPARQVARLDAHLTSCTTCSAEAAAWRGVYARLADVGAFAPREGFADRVMAAVRLPAQVHAPATARPVGARTLMGLRMPDWRPALVAVGRFVPRTRRAWAAISGIAITPAVTVGLVLYTVFSHPTLTPQALASFMVWKASDLLSAAWSGLSGFALDAGQAIGVDAVVRTLFEAPFMLAGGALAYSVVSVLALRVLYKNLLSGRRYARVSHS